MKYKSIYVAATSQHVGKTTTTLGLVSAFQKQGIKVGYSKPVGQNHIDVNGAKVDKDSVLFADLLNFKIIPKIHSPVILGQGATKDLIENPETSHLAKLITNADKKLQKTKDIVIYEGTGHVGVGSVANLSNADVAKLLGAEVIMIVEGGIGSTIDMLNMCLSLFREKNVPLLGVIVNKVIPEKKEMVEKYLGTWLDSQGIKLLGVIPYDKTLGFPLVWSISKAINGDIEYFEERGYKKVEKIVAGSLVDLKSLEDANDLLLVVSARALDKAISKIISISKLKDMAESPLSSIVVTGRDKLTAQSIKYIEENMIPVVRTDLDTYGAVIRISKLEVKINRRTPWKISRAIEMIRENVELNSILSLTKCDL